jgi:hypothetical protein
MDQMAGALLDERLAELRRRRAQAFAEFKALAEKPVLTVTERLDCAEAEELVREFDETIIELKATQEQIARTLGS